MRNYELVCLIQPDLDETAVNGVVERVKGWVTDAGGAVDKIDMWGKRSLAYAIRKQRESNYVPLQSHDVAANDRRSGTEPALHRDRSCVTC